MPAAIHPMLATASDKPFDDPDWLFEIKWDGYRAVAFIRDGKIRLVSRNQNDLTAQYPELHDLAKFIKADSAVLDGEIVALDEAGRSSFSLMQQRTGIRSNGRRTAARGDISVLYYAFDLLYLDGYDLRRVPLEQRKATLAGLVVAGGPVRYSEHFDHGVQLLAAARQQGLEGILAKRRDSLYEERRSSQWIKIKITQTVDCVVGGYTDPEGSRQYFGSIVLGLYDKGGNLIHVGQAGSGFDQKTLAEVWQRLEPLATSKNPFHGKVEALRSVHWVKPKLVAEIKFSDWTHETAEGGMKLRAPVFLRLRRDKNPTGMFVGNCNPRDWPLVTGYCRLLYVLRRQQRAVVVSRGTHSARDHGDESITKLRIFCDQGFDHRHIVLKGLLRVGDVRRLILQFQIKIIPHARRKKSCRFERFARSRQFAGWQIGRLQALHLVVEVIRDQRVHERDRHREFPSLQVVKPRITQFSLGLELGGPLGEPVSVVACEFRRLRVKAPQPPVVALLLEDERNRARSGIGRDIENDHRIFSG